MSGTDKQQNDDKPEDTSGQKAASKALADSSVWYPEKNRTESASMHDASMTGPQASTEKMQLDSDLSAPSNLVNSRKQSKSFNDVLEIAPLAASSKPDLVTSGSQKNSESHESSKQPITESLDFKQGKVIQSLSSETPEKASVPEAYASAAHEMKAGSLLPDVQINAAHQSYPDTGIKNHSEAGINAAYSDGTIKNSDGKNAYQDAGTKTAFADGMTRNAYPDAGIKTTFADGITRNAYPDAGIKTAFPDGIIKNAYSDSAIKTAYSDGGIKTAYSYPDAGIKTGYPIQTAKDFANTNMSSGAEQLGQVLKGYDIPKVAAYSEIQTDKKVFVNDLSMSKLQPSSSISDLMDRQAQGASSNSSEKMKYMADVPAESMQKTLQNISQPLEPKSLNALNSFVGTDLRQQNSQLPVERNIQASGDLGAKMLENNRESLQRDIAKSTEGLDLSMKQYSLEAKQIQPEKTVAPAESIARTPAESINKLPDTLSKETATRPESANNPPVQPEPARNSGSNEPARLEPARVEPAHAEPARVEPARTEPARTEPARVEPARTEPARVEPARVEPARVEPARVEPARVEPARVEPARTEPAHAEPARVEPVRVELARTEPARFEPAHIETGRGETTRVETRAESSRIESQLALQLKTEALLKNGNYELNHLKPEQIAAAAGAAAAAAAEAGKAAAASRPELPQAPAISSNQSLARDSQQQGSRALTELAAPLKTTSPINVSADAASRTQPLDSKAIAPTTTATTLTGRVDLASSTPTTTLTGRTDAASTTTSLTGKLDATTANGRADAASIANAGRAPLSVVSPVIRADLAGGAKPGQTATSVNATFGGAIGVRAGDAALAGRGLPNGRSTISDSSGGKRYLITGVEIGLLLAAAGIAKSRLDARADKSAQDKGGKDNASDLTGRSARQFSIDGRGFPGRVVTLSALLALTGALKVKDMDAALGMKLTERSLRVERTVGAIKKEKLEITLPQIQENPEPETTDKDPSTLDNHMLGFLPAASAFMRARRKNEADDKETKLEEDKENEDTSNSKIPVLRYRRIHQVLAGESLVSIAESKLKDGNLAWLIADLNAPNLTERQVDGRRVVEVLEGTKIELPLAHEIAAFYRRDDKQADPDNLVTIVVEGEFDKDRIERHLNEVLGLARSTT